MMMMMMMMMMIIIIIIIIIICKETGVKLDKNTGMNMYKISRNKSRRQGNHIVESKSTN